MRGRAWLRYFPHPAPGRRNHPADCTVRGQADECRWQARWVLTVGLGGGDQRSRVPHRRRRAHEQDGPYRLRTRELSPERGRTGQRSKFPSQARRFAQCQWTYAAMWSRGARPIGPSPSPEVSGMTGGLAPGLANHHGRAGSCCQRPEGGDQQGEAAVRRRKLHGRVGHGRLADEVVDVEHEHLVAIA